MLGIAEIRWTPELRNFGQDDVRRANSGECLVHILIAVVTRGMVDRRVQRKMGWDYRVVLGSGYPDYMESWFLERDFLDP